MIFLNTTVLSFQSHVSTPLPTTLGSLIKTYFWVIYLHETRVENRDASDKESRAMAVMHVISSKIVENYS